MKNRRVFAGRNSPWVESWLLNWLEVVKITSASTGLFPSPGGAIRAGWCKHRDRRIKQQSSTRRTSQGRSRAPRNTLSFLIALEAVTPREPERRTLPDSALGSGDTGQRPPGAPGQGTPRAPGLDFGAPGLSSSSCCVCLAVDEFPPRVLAQKGALGGPEKARGHLAGQIPAGPARASPIGGVLVGGTRGVRIPGIYSLSRRAGSLECLTSGLAQGPASIRSSFLSFPFLFPFADPPLSFSILHCIYLLTRVLCKSLSVGPTFPPPLP